MQVELDMTGSNRAKADTINTPCLTQRQLLLMLWQVPVCIPAKHCLLVYPEDDSEATASIQFSSKIIDGQALKDTCFQS